MLKKVASIAMAGALATGLAACSNGTNDSAASGSSAASPSPASSGSAAASPAASGTSAAGGAAVDRNSKVKIRLMTHYTDDARRNLLNEAIAQFKQEWPNADVEDETTSEYGTKMKLEFTAGNGPDFVTVDDLLQQTLMQGGYLADITDMVERNHYIDQSVPGAVEFNNLRTPGHYYSVPFLMAPVVMYYNKDIFSELGASAPTTIDDLEAILDKAKQAGYIPLADAGSANLNVMWLAYQLIFANTNFEDLQKWYYQESTPDSVKQGFIQAFTKIKEWTDKGYFGDTKIAMGVSYDSYIGSLFAQGKTAMAMDGDWNISGFTDSGVNTGVFAFPTDYIVNATDNGWALNAKADDVKKAAFEDFVNIFYSKDMISKYYTAGYTPSVKFDTTGLSVSPLRTELQNAVSDKKLGYFLDNAVPGLGDIIAKSTQDLMLGKLTPEQCWDEIAAGYEKGKGTAAN